MKTRSLHTQTASCAFGLATLLLLGACGGRYQTVRDSEDDSMSGSSGRSGAPSIVHAGSGRGGVGMVGIGGTSSAGASAAGMSNAGAHSGGTNSGGAIGSAGSGGGDCRFTKCMGGGLTCLAGQQRVTEPGQCCPTKCSACPPCPMLKCPAGYHLETAASDCCPQCSPDPNVDRCLVGQQEYAMQRSLMVDKYSYGCATTSDCVLIATVNACEPVCSYAGVWSAVADSLQSNLANLADANCSSCMQGTLPLCPPVQPPTCVNGRCTF
ncbi:MAG TPA: hypothetical protein VFK05_27685 [Polyangiaceae bacterium]|nr:hypothetical protein [Polyangiaceae bacterium]